MMVVGYEMEIFRLEDQTFELGVPTPSSWISGKEK